MIATRTIEYKDASLVHIMNVKRHRLLVYLECEYYITVHNNVNLQHQNYATSVTSRRPIYARYRI